MSLPIHLNVGGQNFFTTYSTLTQREPQSKLATHVLSSAPTQSEIFVDR